MPVRDSAPLSIGSRFGRWTVVQYAGRNHHAKPTYLCRCDCGTEAIVIAGNLKSNISKSCGCLKSERAKKLLPVGFRYGRWTVIDSDVGRDGISRVTCRVRCDCGNEAVMPATHLRQGGSRSCGCLTREISSENAVRVHQTHGMTHTPEHAAWTGMKTRCTNPNIKCYPSYGGRGISVCGEWMNSFETFYRDMGPRPGPGYSIDRIDVNGNYCPENCHWATKLEQSNNRRGVISVELDGETKSFAQWCRDLRIDYDGAYYWITQGSTPADALRKQVQREADGWRKPSAAAPAGADAGAESAHACAGA